MLPSALPFPEIDPVIFAIEIGNFTLALRWYALAYLAGFLLAWRWMVWMIRRPALWANDITPMSDKDPEDLMTWLIIGVILGGRLGFVFFYNFDYYAANPGQILQIWQGGMSFHGGFLGVIVAAFLFCRFRGLSAPSVADAIAAGTPFGLFLGRIANFINAELWGRPTDVPWGVAFPGPDAATCPPFWQAAVCARHPSQLYEALLEGLLLFLVMAWLITRRKWLKTPGAITGVFFLGYGLARTFVEAFRQGDAQFVTATNPWGHVIRFGQDAEAWGLSMGQILSLPMVVIGLILIVAARRQA